MSTELKHGVTFTLFAIILILWIEDLVSREPTFGIPIVVTSMLLVWLIYMLINYD